MTASQGNNWGNSIACSVMSDALTVVRKLSKHYVNCNTTSTTNLRDASTNGVIDLPEWLNHYAADAAYRNRTTLPTDHATYVFSGDALMNRLMKMESYDLSDMYGSVFNNLFIVAKRQKVISSDLMNLQLLGPPWMKITVNFVYRPARNKKNCFH